jgi:formate dehydrogenase major subunit
MKGSEVVRMCPWKDGKANEGHACVKGRFAGAMPRTRTASPRPRSARRSPTRGRRELDEAIAYVRGEFKRIQSRVRPRLDRRHRLLALHNEEGYLVQKLVRAAFGNNNVDTCARVCHSPTGYGLKQTSASRPARRPSSRSRSPT